MSRKLAQARLEFSLALAVAWTALKSNELLIPSQDWGGGGGVEIDWFTAFSVFQFSRGGGGGEGRH